MKRCLWCQQPTADRLLCPPCQVRADAAADHERIAKEAERFAAKRGKYRR